MPLNSKALEAKVFDILGRYTCRQDPITQNDMIAEDLGIVGDDGVDVLYDLEEAFGVDLAPLIEAHASPMPARFIDRLFGRREGPLNADLSVGDLVAYIGKQSGKG